MNTNNNTKKDAPLNPKKRGSLNSIMKETLTVSIPKLQQENKTLKSIVERQDKDLGELKQLETGFYMAICRAYNAGKQSMNNQHAADKNGDNGGKSAFVSSHEYFLSEFPEFKTNVP